MKSLNSLIWRNIYNVFFFQGLWAFDCENCKNCFGNKELTGKKRFRLCISKSPLYVNEKVMTSCWLSTYMTTRKYLVCCYPELQTSDSIKVIHQSLPRVNSIIIICSASQRNCRSWLQSRARASSLSFNYLLQQSLSQFLPNNFLMWKMILIYLVFKLCYESFFLPYQEDLPFVVYVTRDRIK